MPRSNLLVLECEFCGTKDTFNQGDPNSMAKPKIHKWLQVSRADDPVQGPVDRSRWFDSVECMYSGMKREDRVGDVIEKLPQGPLPPEAALPPITEITKRDA